MNSITVTLLIIITFTTTTTLLFGSQQVECFQNQTKQTVDTEPTKVQQVEVVDNPTKQKDEKAANSALNGYSTSIASLFGAIQDSSFRYFNIEVDQCRNRASCDLGYVLYKRLGFVHNWLLRTSVRHMVDPSNIYAQSWVEGMLGRNCSSIHISCQQSPLDSLMGLALLQRFGV